MLTIFVIVGGWVYLSGPNEKWVHYQQQESKEIVLGEFSSYELCSDQMKEQMGTGGCKRIDGPYGRLNAIMDKLFPSN